MWSRPGSETLSLRSAMASNCGLLCNMMFDSREDTVSAPALPVLIQKKIVRVMTNAHTNPIFIQLEFLKIEDIRQLQLFSFIYGCLNKTAPVFFYDKFYTQFRTPYF